jgi:predicted Zn-dependent protease with MMP-like domain
MVSFEQRKRSNRTLDRIRQLRFERAVERVLKSLPPDISMMLSNVDVVVANEPNADQLAQVEAGDSLFGLYEGIPQTERAGYNLALPDKITIFRGPIERARDTEDEIAEEIRVTVLHELAHHIGFDEDRIEELGLG